MVPNVSRGFSFKGLTDYLTHDKREEGREDGPDADSAERVGFISLLNFDDGEARTPAEAAKVMALVVRDADRLKQSAGVRATGNKAVAAPVFHMSLSWAKSERVDRAEMVRAMGEALAAPGLQLAKGYQTFCVEHTDTDHQHLHVVVNLVHPISGKQANPHRDQPKLQEWARSYEKQRGQVFCHDREAKHAAIDKARRSQPTPGRAAFNDKAQGEAGKAPARPAPSRPAATRPARRVPYHVWQAQQAAHTEAERTAAHQVKEGLGGRYRDMRASHEAGYQRRQQEIGQHRADAQGGRNAIYEKYASALDAIFKPMPGPKEAAPERTAWANVAQRLAERRNAFDRRESSTFGRFLNARDLAKGASLFRVLRLAINPAERRKLFEREQRTTQAKLAPRGPERAARNPNQPKTPDLPYKRAASLKAMRAAELADHARRQAAGSASMEARHQFQRQAEQAQREAFKVESKQAWERHRQAFAQQKEAREQDNARAASVRATTPEQARSAVPANANRAPEAAAPEQERKADKFGRSRDRKPRQPRAAKDQGEGKGDSGRQITGEGTTDGQNRPVERVQASEGMENTSVTAEATHGADLGQSDPAVTAKPWTPEERVAKIAAEQARMDARRSSQERDMGNERTLSR